MTVLKTVLTGWIAFAIATSGLAQSAGPQGQAQPPADTKQEPKKDPKVDEYDKAIKDLKRVDGPFPMYQRKKEILLELSESMLEKVWLLQATFSTGGSTELQAGDPVNFGANDAFKWVKQDESIWLVRPNLKFRWTADDPLATAAARSFPEAILGSFRIEQTNPEKKLFLVNVTSLFEGSAIRLNEAAMMGLGGPYQLDREKSAVERIKGFPNNTVVAMRMHFVAQRAPEQSPMLALLGLSSVSMLEDGRSALIHVIYNLSYRQDSDYMPRMSDPRIGYFTQDFFNVGNWTKQDRTTRFINRWNLKKKDPAAKLSEPVHPIVWTIDNSVPPAYRDAVREGILRWNKAFEELGYKNAVQVQEVPKGDTDYDHADGRYNVVRWTVTPERAYAIALFRTDPFSGEILNASVTMDANMLEFVFREHARITVPATEAARVAMEAVAPTLRKRYDSNEWMFDGTDLGHAMTPAIDPGKLSDLGWQRNECSYGPGLAESAAFAYNLMEALPFGKVMGREQYAKAFITDVISHEVGHCMGLRHNFVASTNLSVGQLADDNITNKVGIAASVMDYTPVNLAAAMKGARNLYAPGIGPYDEWAIRYGYADVKASTPEGERYVLNQIARENGQPGKAFMTDEEADKWNPYVVRFDLSKDPLAFLETEIEAAKRVRQFAVRNLPMPGQTYDVKTQMLLWSLNRTFRSGRYAARFVGGLVTNRSQRGDAVERSTIQPVDPAVQRRAVQLIAHECLAMGTVDLPQDTIDHMTLDPESEAAASWNAPMRGQISGQQILLFGALMSSTTLDQIAENEFRTKDRTKAYSMSEHFSAILGAVFSEIGQNRSIEPTRRDLQRFAVNSLIAQAGARLGMGNEDVKVLSADALRRLGARYESQLRKPAGLDAMTVSYLRETKQTIARFLERRSSGTP